MALIKCKECGHMISEKALVCPKCGYPVEKGNNLLEEKGNTNKNSSTPSKSVGRKWRLSDILWIVILFGIAFAMIYYATISSKSSDSSTTEASSTTEVSYGPGTYEFVDEAGQQWQLIIEIERTGSEEDYTYKEKKVCTLKNLSDGKEYEGGWNDHDGAIYRTGKYEGVSDDNFSVSIYWDGYWGKMRDTPYPSSYIIFQKMPAHPWGKYYLEEGYMYWDITDSKDINGNEFGFEEAFINRDPRLRLPIKKVK